MFKYNAGDRVVIVDYEDVIGKKEFPGFTYSMKKYCGKEATIRDMDIELGEKIIYFVEFGFAWREDWVMPSLKIDADNFDKFLMED